MKLQTGASSWTFEPEDPTFSGGRHPIVKAEEKSKHSEVVISRTCQGYFQVKLKKDCYVLE